MHCCVSFELKMRYGIVVDRKCNVNAFCGLKLTGGMNV